MTAGGRQPGDASALERALRDAVRRRRDDLFELTAALVRVPSLLGEEEPAQAIVEQRLRDTGFAVERVTPVAEEALADPHGGYPSHDYEGRSCVVGRLAGGGAGTIHLSGHVDVVPVEDPEAWTHDPWGAEISDGRMWGRGAGDMKAGVAAYLIAVEAALEVVGPLAADVIFSSVIEEESGGNGMRAVIGAGFEGDAVLIGEPSALDLMHAGVGVIWFSLTATGGGAHAAYADGSGPLDQLVAAIAALRRLEQRFNEGAAEDPVYSRASAHPFNLSLGMLHGGLWPSSVPVRSVLRGRIGFGPKVTPAAAQALVAEVVHDAAPDVEVAFDGFRAPAYCHDPADALGLALTRAHTARHGRAPAPSVATFTTDARHVAGSCLCYGPIAGSIHGTDEWVDLDSVEAVAAVVAQVVAEHAHGVRDM